MNTEHRPSNASNYQRMATAIRFLRENTTAQPQLEDVAAATGISASHCQRLFKRYSGVSPKRFLQYLTVDHAKALLRESASVMDAALETGLSGPSRLHDHFVSIEAMTPGEYRHGGAGLTISYGICETDFGRIFLAQTDRGICRLGFLDEESSDENRIQEKLARERDCLAECWPSANLIEDNIAVRRTAKQIFSANPNKPLSLLVQGTNFQIKVWEALLGIPEGKVTSYGQLAKLIGQPLASRAIGSAVGANPVAVLIPCHRVIRGDGGLGGYHWGLERKQLLLASETQ